VVTIGGGIVLDAAPTPRMAGHYDFLKILNGGDSEAILLARISRRQRDGTRLSRLVSETGWATNVIEAQLAAAAGHGRIFRAGDLVVDGPAFLELQPAIVGAVEDFQKKNPLVGGIAKEELRERVGAIGEVFEAALGWLLREKKIEVTGEMVRMPGRGVALKDEEAESKRTIEDAFASAGLEVPALQAVIAGLKVDRTRAQKIVTLMLREKVLIKVSDDLVFHRNALQDLRGKLATHKLKSSKIDVAQFKALTGVTRKYAIPLLEYLDRERVTKRSGDAREIL
jgi:selenocysteine-specific elongation factor